MLVEGGELKANVSKASREEGRGGGRGENGEVPRMAKRVKVRNVRRRLGGHRSQSRFPICFETTTGPSTSGSGGNPKTTTAFLPDRGAAWRRHKAAVHVRAETCPLPASEGTEPAPLPEQGFAVVVIARRHQIRTADPPVPCGV